MASAVPFAPASTRLWHEERRFFWRGIDEHGRQVFVHFNDRLRDDYSVQGSDGKRPLRDLEGRERDEVVADLMAWADANGWEIPATGETNGR